MRDMNRLQRVVREAEAVARLFKPMLVADGVIGVGFITCAEVIAGWSQDEVAIERDVRRVTMQAFFLA
jgi:hypothetical protein